MVKKRLLKNYRNASVIAFLLFGLCVALLVPVFSQGPEPLLVKYRERWFTQSSTYVTGVAVGDLDNDGIDEIVTGGRYYTGETSYGGEFVRYGQIKIWAWNDTDFAPKYTKNWTLPGDAQPWWRGINAIEIEDVDNDGTKEIITAGYRWEHISVPPWMGTYEGEIGIWNWTGTVLQQEYVHKWYYVKDNQINDVWIDDVDADGAKEILTCGIWVNMVNPFDPNTFLTQAQLNVWRWDGTVFSGIYNQTWGAAAPLRVEPNSVYASDVDNDTDMEILTGGYTRNGSIYTSQLRIWNWNETVMDLEHNEEWSTNCTRGVITVFAEDVTDDGGIEIMTGGYGAASSYDLVKAWAWNGSNLTLVYNEENVPPYGMYVYAFDYADADTDGVDEFITYGHAYNGTIWSAALTMMEWDGFGMVLDHEATWGNNTRGLGIRTADVDNDNLSEIITADWQHDGIRWNGQLSIQYYADTTPPVIGDPVQNPPGSTINPGQSVKISVEVTDLQTGVNYVDLNYTTNNGTSWTLEPMIYNGTSGLYEATILGQDPDTWVEYMIMASDKAGNPAVKDNGGVYYVYLVIPEFQNLLLIMLMLTTLMAVILVKIRKQSTPHFFKFRKKSRY